MAISIAISGKGGSGKTTVTALMVRVLKGQAGGAILAVDADANSCLGMALGVEPAGTVADLRDEVLKGSSGGGMGRIDAFELGMHQMITEAKGFDLLTMGRPEGPKCYCAVNNMLRKLLDDLSSSYSFVITDNEAGMEHLSRQTTNNVDLLIIVGEPTKVGITTVERILQLTKELPITVRKVGVVWNRTTQSVEMDGLNVLGYIPYDDSLMEAALEGDTVFDLAQDNPALAAVREILERNLSISQAS